MLVVPDTLDVVDTTRMSSVNLTVSLPFVLLRPGPLHFLLAGLPLPICSSVCECTPWNNTTWSSAPSWSRHTALFHLFLVGANINNLLYYRRLSFARRFPLELGQCCVRSQRSVYDQLCSLYLAAFGAIGTKLLGQAPKIKRRMSRLYCTYEALIATAPL